MIVKRVFSLFIVSDWVSCISAIPRLIEEERVQEYHGLQHTWPLLDSEFVPATEGWIRLMRRRLEQVDVFLENSYDGYISTLTSAMSPNYTEFGWGLSRAPQELWQAVASYVNHNNIQEILADAPPEARDEAIMTLNNDLSLLPLFVNIPDDLKTRILNELQPLLEAWSGGIELVPQTAYGLRVYQNTSSMYMHIDETRTHVISAIFHIGHDTETPWPLVIEDFEGNTNEVWLHAGDLLLYESSKCLHGRPRRMNGKWYTSIFVHYYPKTFAIDFDQIEWNIHHRVPPGWRETKKNDDDEDQNLDRFVRNDTFCFEPDCPDEWCLLQNSTIISGPAPEFGTILTTKGRMQHLLSPDPDQSHHGGLDEL